MPYTRPSRGQAIEGVGSVDLAAQKECYSEAFLFAVAAAAGFGVAKPAPDTDSVDWTLSAGGELARRPKLDLQLKATAMAQDVLGETHLTFRLSKKNYDDLRDDLLMVPRVLLVVVVPDDASNWLVQTEELMAMSHCGYWMSLAGLPELTHETVTVHVPRANRWERDSLMQIMARISIGEPVGGRPT